MTLQNGLSSVGENQNTAYLCKYKMCHSIPVVRGVYETF